jgi:molecular chaperone GrpE (heat shock protein)
MNSYEILSKLEGKADNYKVFNLENENRNLRAKISTLEDKLNNSKNDIYNLRNALQRLIDTLCENNGVSVDELTYIKHQF